jgi:hypothetical protein
MESYEVEVGGKTHQGESQIGDVCLTCSQSD